MSLRDQLLSKGLVSGKRARAIDRDKKRQRKQNKGSLQKKRVREASERQAQTDAAEARLKERQAIRSRYERERARMEQALRVRQLLDHHALRAGGRVPFHHRLVEPTCIGRIWVNASTAFRLRNGSLAIARDSARDRYVVVPADVADRLSDISAELVVSRVERTEGLSAPDLVLPVCDGVVCFRAHRRKRP